MKALLCMGLLVTLVACGDTRTKDYYLDHPDEIKTDLAECQKEGKNTYNCNQATLAQFQLKNSGASAHP
ncbi:MAG: EexN family lipoprotein [Betaproteobacteria bacterium]|nr:EexN family lipoprotein [Betaproteobacteria bacterium]